MATRLSEKSDFVHPTPGLVSYYPDAYENLPKDISPALFIQRVRTGFVKEKITTIRNRFKEAMGRSDGNRNASKKVIDYHKKKLPSVNTSGTFAVRGNTQLLQHSGLLQVDVDGIGESEAAALRDKGRACSFIYAAFVSPSGDGVKFWVRVPMCKNGSEHKQTHTEARRVFKTEMGVDIAALDDSVKDLARLCYMSYDPDAWMNEAATSLPVEFSETPEPTAVKVQTPAASTGDKEAASDIRPQVEAITGPVRWESETCGFCDCPGKHLHTGIDGERDCKIERRGEDGSWFAYCFHNSCRAALAKLNRKLNNVAHIANAVVLFGGSVRITDTATDLFKRVASSRKMFTRGRVPVVVRTEDGKQVLSPLKPTQAQSEFEAHADFAAWKSVKADKDEGGGTKSVLKPTTLSATHAAAILDCYAATNLLPQINGLLNCPILIERNGALEVCGEGYNESTGLLILRGGTPPEVPLPEARESLLGLLEEFDFQTPGDKSRALASLITPAFKMGGLIQGNVPADVAEADQSQSGKTYRHRASAAIFREESAIVPLKRGGVGGVDEALYEKAVQGRPFIQFDNFRGTLDSPALEAFLTAEKSFGCRVPGVREIAVDPSRFFIQLTSNGVETSRDLANRSSIIRIRKREGVQFKDVLGDIRARQPYYLGCVFAVVREWHRQGKPRTQEMRHDFREWCQVLDWIVQNIFGLAPLMDGHREAQQRVSNPTLGLLRALCLEVARADDLGKPLTAMQLCDLGEAAGLKMPGGESGASHKALGSKLAPLFKNGSDSVSVEGFTVWRRTEQRQRDDGNGSYDVKLYIVDRNGPGPEVVSGGKETTHGTVSTATTATTVTPSVVSKNVSDFSGNVSGEATPPCCGNCGTVDAPAAKTAPLPGMSWRDVSNPPKRTVVVSFRRDKAAIPAAIGGAA